MITANRYHDICAGHRVVGHEGKCRNLHGHNYRFHFKVEPTEGLDSIGRVLDFSVIKHLLCTWLENMWEHKMLIWVDDPLLPALQQIDSNIVKVTFNPTAENIAEYFVETIAPRLLREYPARLVELTLEETRKCSVTYKIKQP